MGYRVKDQMSPHIYPWWLILVGFVVGVFVTLVVTGFSHPAAAESSAYPQEIRQIICDATPTAPASENLITPSVNLDPLLVQATQMVLDATRTAEAALRTRCATIVQTTPPSNAQSFDNGMAFPTDDPIFMTATAIVIQATLQTPQQAPSP